MEAVYFTLVAVGLYFFSDWLLERIERLRGKRFEQRSIVFFAIIAVLALISFQVIQILMRSALTRRPLKNKTFFAAKAQRRKDFSC
jgi:hypothetical protein